jgi:predicted RND superfamily exporter protein
VAAHPGRFILGVGLLLAVAASGIPLVEINSPLLADLDPSHPIIETNRILEDRMAGVVNLELLVEPGTEDLGTIYGTERIHQVDLLASKVRELEGVVTVTSVTDPLHHFAREFFDGSATDPATLLPAALLLAAPSFAQWIDEETRVMRIRIKVRNLDTKSSLALFDTIGSLYEDILGESSKGRLTGQGYIGQRINQRIVSHLQLSFFAAIGAVLLFLMIALRSLRLVLVSILPNILPLVLISGVMGYAGIDLRYTSALVLTVVFGIAVDDTIHFIAQVHARRHSQDPIREAYLSAGHGILLTSIILALGFSVLLQGTIIPNRVLGGLLMMTAISALIGDLLLLPALLRVWPVSRGRR